MEREKRKWHGRGVCSFFLKSVVISCTSCFILTRVVEELNKANNGYYLRVCL